MIYNITIILIVLGVFKAMLKNNSKAEITAMIVAISGFLIILYFVLTGNTASFDDPVRNFFYNLRAEWLTPVVKVITYLGNWQSITILCLILLFIKSTRKIYGIPVSIGAVTVTVLNKIIKSLVSRPRPDDIIHLVHAGGFSFPSGHSITSMCVFGMLIYLIRRNVKNKKKADLFTIILAIPMVCIGLSRIYLGVHYPTDVLAGWCLGIIIIILVTKLSYIIIDTTKAGDF